MRSSGVLKILAFLITCVIIIICYQILLTTSFFNHIDSKIPQADPVPLGKGVGNVKVILENEPPGAATAKKNEPVHEINVVITFTNAKDNTNLQQKFQTTVLSMFKWTTTPVNIYIIGDQASQVIADAILKQAVSKYNKQYKLLKLDTDDLAKKLHEVIKEMQQHFSYKPGAYYSHSLFFLSIAIHRVMPETLHRVIMMDADLKFNNDVKELFDLFDNFSDTNVMGIARENQPVYRHVLSVYRGANPGTRVGDPPPNGITGFNSGVLLLNLDKMRKSELYNSLINPKVVNNLTQKYSFQGHLGDQDFFTLLSLEHENLFYILPCTWNRQLCVWWRDKGYESVFDLYFKCEGHINIYHGNGNTDIPKLDWEK